MLAINTPITAITTTVIRATSMDIFSVILIWKQSFTRFCDTAEAAAKSCESAVDIVAASIPARISPPIIAGIAPYVLNKCATRTIIVSELLPVSTSIAPAFDML